jgi:hypothetical protein
VPISTCVTLKNSASCPELISEFCVNFSMKSDHATSSGCFYSADEMGFRNKYSKIFGFKILRYIFSFIRNTKRITYKKDFEIRCHFPSRKVNY